MRPVADEMRHPCPGGCGLRIVRNMLSCRECWYRLPGPIRAAVAAAFPRRVKDPRAHREALAEAMAWYRTNPRGVPG